MDLTKTVPRSPREELEDMKILPRAIDKARAQLAGTLGDYIYYDCRFNLKLFNTLGVTEDEFLDAVRTSPDDAAVAEWVRDFVHPERDKIDAMNAWVENNEPQTPDERKQFEAELAEIDPSNTTARTWTDLIALEERSASISHASQ